MKLYVILPVGYDKPRNVAYKSKQKAQEQIPDLKSFSWKQYTPYFNDGDTCRFGAHTDSPTINGYDYQKSEEYQWQQAVTKFLSDFEQQDLLSLFGDHKEITVSREHTVAEDYSHD